MSSAPSYGSRHCPPFKPTGLADGLELEVFYAKCLNLSALRFAPGPVFTRAGGSPASFVRKHDDFGRQDFQQLKITLADNANQAQPPT